MAVVIFLFIEPTIEKEGGYKRVAEDDTTFEDGLLGGEGATGPAPAGGNWVDRIPSGLRKPVGVALSVFAGLCYASNFDPPTYIVEHPDAYPGASAQLVDHVFGL